MVRRKPEGVVGEGNSNYETLYQHTTQLLVIRIKNELLQVEFEPMTCSIYTKCVVSQ